MVLESLPVRLIHSTFTIFSERAFSPATPATSLTKLVRKPLMDANTFKNLLDAIVDPHEIGTKIFAVITAASGFLGKALFDRWWSEVGVSTKLSFPIWIKDVILARSDAKGCSARPTRISPTGFGIRGLQSRGIRYLLGLKPIPRLSSDILVPPTIRAPVLSEMCCSFA